MPWSPVTSSGDVVDNNAAMPGLSAELVETRYESPAAGPHVTQRITLGFRLKFASSNAFNGIAAGAQRDLRTLPNDEFHPLAQISVDPQTRAPGAPHGSVGVGAEAQAHANPGPAFVVFQQAIAMAIESREGQPHL